MRIIDADRTVTVSVYDDEFEECADEKMTISEALNRFTAEGCPEECTGWIPVTSGLPEEKDSIFAKLYGTPKWNRHMFRKRSDNVIVTVRYEDGTLKAETAHTTDGKWRMRDNVAVIQREVIAWKPMPEPWKGAM